MHIFNKYVERGVNRPRLTHGEDHSSVLCGGGGSMPSDLEMSPSRSDSSFFMDLGEGGDGTCPAISLSLRCSSNLLSQFFIFETFNSL